MNASDPASASTQSAIDRIMLALKQSPYGCDLSISAFISACLHYRRATICQPFPAELFATHPSRGTPNRTGNNSRARSSSAPGEIPGNSRGTGAGAVSSDSVSLVPTISDTQHATSSAGCTDSNSSHAPLVSDISGSLPACAPTTAPTRPFFSAEALSLLQPHSLPLFSAVDRTPELRACMAAVATIPSVSATLSDPSLLASLTPQTLNLMSWLLSDPTQAKNIAALPSSSWQTDLQHRHPLWRCQAIPDNQQPSHNLKMLDNAKAAPFKRSMVAFHGTHFENLHSVLHSGLRIASGTKLQRNAAAFGAGIYLSAQYHVASSFTQPADGWLNSMLGSRLRCLLVCEVDLDEVKFVGAAAASGTKVTAAVKVPVDDAIDNETGPPDAYMLVQKTEAIRLLYVLTFSEPRASRAVNMNWCTLIIILYGLFLLGQGLLRSGALDKLQVSDWIDRSRGFL